MILAKYTATGYTFAAEVEASGLTAADLVNYGCDGFQYYAEGFATDPIINANPLTIATTRELSLSNGCYWTLTITPDSGKKLNLEKLTFNVGRGGASTPRGLVVRSSVDGYDVDLYSAEILTYVPNFTAVNIDLTAAKYQGLTSAFTLRFYVWAPNASNSVDCDDITIEGDIALVGSPSSVVRLYGTVGSKGPTGDTGANGNASSCWAVGSIYVSVSATNPATLFGFGTWVEIAAGRLLVGLNSGDTDFDTVEEVGGAKTVQKSGTVSQPTFTGTTNQATNQASAGSTQAGSTASTKTLRTHTHTITFTGTVSQPTFTGDSNSVVQPYFVVHFYKRTA
jgi:hypothetical protein